MTWIGGFLICGLSASFEWYRYLWRRWDDPERAEWVRPGRSWIADRVPAIGRWQYATLHRLNPSSDPAIEASRRGANATAVLSGVWLFAGLFLGYGVDTVASAASRLAPPFAVLAVGGTWLALAALSRLLVAVRDPDRSRPLSAPLVALAVGLSGLLAACLAAAIA